METCEDIRQTIGMKDLYSHRKETIEKNLWNSKKNHGFRYTQMYGKADENEGRAHLCVYEFKKLAKYKKEWGLQMA